MEAPIMAALGVVNRKRLVLGLTRYAIPIFTLKKIKILNLENFGKIVKYFEKYFQHFGFLALDLVSMHDVE